MISANFDLERENISSRRSLIGSFIEPEQNQDTKSGNFRALSHAWTADEENNDNFHLETSTFDRSSKIGSFIESKPKTSKTKSSEDEFSDQPKVAKFRPLTAVWNQIDVPVAEPDNMTKLGSFASSEYIPPRTTSRKYVKKSSADDISLDSRLSAVGSIEKEPHRSSTGISLEPKGKHKNLSTIGSIIENPEIWSPSPTEEEIPEKSKFRPLTTVWNEDLTLKSSEDPNITPREDTFKVTLDDKSSRVSRIGSFMNSYDFEQKTSSDLQALSPLKDDPQKDIQSEKPYSEIDLDKKSSKRQSRIGSYIDKNDIFRPLSTALKEFINDEGEKADLPSLDSNRTSKISLADPKRVSFRPLSVAFNDVVVKKRKPSTPKVTAIRAFSVILDEEEEIGEQRDYTEDECYRTVVDPENVPAHLVHSASLFNAYDKKVYGFGFLKLSEIFNVQGDLVSQQSTLSDVIITMNQSTYYCELKGSNLFFWTISVLEGITIEKIEEIKYNQPGVLRILDCILQILPNTKYLQETLALRFAGMKAMYVQSAIEEKESWVKAIRLSSYEYGKFAEIYTIKQLRYNSGDSITRYPKPSFTGNVRIFHLGDPTWKAYSCILREDDDAVKSQFLKENGWEDEKFDSETLFFKSTIPGTTDIAICIKDLYLCHYLIPKFDGSNQLCVRIEGNFIFGSRYREMNECHGRVEFVVMKLSSSGDLYQFFKSLIFKFHIYTEKGRSNIAPLKIAPPTSPPTSALYLELQDVIDVPLYDSLVGMKIQYDYQVMAKFGENFFARLRKSSRKAMDARTVAPDRILQEIDEGEIPNEPHSQQPKWQLDSSEDEDQEDLEAEDSDVIERSDDEKDSEDEPIGGLKKEDIVKEPEFASLQDGDPNEDEELIVPEIVRFGGLLAKPTKEVRKRQAIEDRQQYYSRLQEEQKRAKEDAMKLVARHREAQQQHSEKIKESSGRAPRKGTESTQRPPRTSSLNEVRNVEEKVDESESLVETSIVKRPRRPRRNE